MEEKYADLVARLASPAVIDLCDADANILHALMGVASESGELLDMFKAALFYGKDFDKVNLVEEIGDILWFAQLALNQLDLTLEDAIKGNRAKLNARYAEGFSEAKALNRKKEFELEQLKEAVWGDKEVGTK